MQIDLGILNKMGGMTHSLEAGDLGYDEHARSRRNFVRGALGAAAGLALDALSPGHAQAQEAISRPMPYSTPAFTGSQAQFFARESSFFRGFAGLFQLDPRVVYFMAGQKGSMAAPVLSRLKAGLDQIARDPFDVFVEPVDRLRATIGSGYGASVDEIAIACNTSDALSQILMGIDWQRGDEILMSPLEHPASIGPMLRIAVRYGVTIRQFGIPSRWDTESDEIVGSVARQLRPGVTKVLLFSSPLWPTGMRMPERKLAALAQRYGVITVVDGAHYGGMFDPKLDESGIDFWAIAGHKWQCGPGGTGILYARNRASTANALPLPKLHLIRCAETTGLPRDGERPENFDIGAALSDYGSPESATWRALADACALWDCIGRQRIEQWITTLADYLRDRIASAFGREAILQPGRDPALKSGIVAFNPFPYASARQDLRTNTVFRERLLREYGIRISGGGLGPDGLTQSPDPDARKFFPGLIPNRDPHTLAPAPMDHPHRADACVWTQPEHVDYLVSSMKALVADMTN
jgi:isopenicillin-N epimerase